MATMVKSTCLGAEEEEKSVRSVGEGCVGAFFRGKDVLVTGASGFVGRVLVEKLLREAPGVGTLFLLLRPKRGQAPHQRIPHFTDVKLFERLRLEQPHALRKLRAVAGDSALPGLGLSEADAEMLAERVSVVFHLAASVRFDDPLHKAVRVNVCSTHALLELATRMPHLVSFVHVSTTYCNTGQQVFEEKLYPVPADWRSVVKAAESADPMLLRVLTEKILGEHRNTYTFTKALAEHIINEYTDRLPLAIVRPSVVVGTGIDPIPGWMDNFNGPTGLLLGAGKGIVHTGYSDPQAHIDYIPCDILVKGIIISSWEVAKRGVGELMVYQGAQADVNRITQGRIIDLAIEVVAELPFEESLYKPSGGLTKYRWLFYVQFFFFHLLPAVVVDAGLSISGRRPLLLRLQRRIYLANLALSCFVLQNWNFVNKGFLGLEDKLLDCDKDAFAYRFQHECFHPTTFFKEALKGARKYLLHEPDENLPIAKKRYQRQRVVHLVLKTLFYTYIPWFALSRVYAILIGN